MEIERFDWKKDEVRDIFNTPLIELIHRSSRVHRHFHNPLEIQVCTLLSVKTGGCPEDCAYCPQSARHSTNLRSEKLLPVNKVLDAAREAKNAGATRFCLGAAWKRVRDNTEFDQVLEMVRGIAALGLEVCCTLGMVTKDQALKLKEAGLYAYNHNLDTSREFYGKIISTRTYDDRLETIKNARSAGLTLCCGGIIGMGESEEDRIALLNTLACLTPHPESVPINSLVPIEGTPLEGTPPVDPFEIVRMVACARILMPKSTVRLSAGRLDMSKETQALCFLAGANSIFSGDKLLTTANTPAQADKEMFKILGLKARKAYKSKLELREAV